MTSTKYEYTEEELQENAEHTQKMNLIRRIRKPLQTENDALKTRILRLEERIAELMKERA